MNTQKRHEKHDRSRSNFNKVMLAELDKLKAESDYDDGVEDCLNGHAPRANASKAYLRGYGDQYAAEQTQSEITKGH